MGLPFKQPITKGSTYFLVAKTIHLPPLPTPPHVLKTFIVLMAVGLQILPGFNMQ